MSIEKIYKKLSKRAFDKKKTVRSGEILLILLENQGGQ